MPILIDFVAKYAPWIYFVCGIIALYQMYRTWLVRAERRQAVFSLEREKAVRDLSNIFSTAMVLVLVMGATYFTSTTLARVLEPLIEEAVAPSPELEFIPTPTNTPLSVTPTPLRVEAGITPTATILSQTTPIVVTTPTVAGIAPTATPAPIVQSPTCFNENSIMLRPGANETVRGVITIVGTASHPAFQYYKIEYSPAGAGNWSYLAGDHNAVVNGVLANVDSNVLGNGAWTIRLVVVDQTGNYPEPCQVTIFVEN